MSHRLCLTIDEIRYCDYSRADFSPTGANRWCDLREFWQEGWGFGTKTQKFDPPGPASSPRKGKPLA